MQEVEHVQPVAKAQPLGAENQKTEKCDCEQFAADTTLKVPQMYK